MKVGIICYNHFDATIPLAKHLKRLFPEIGIEFIFILAKDQLDVEIFSLSSYDLKTGFINKQDIPKIVDREILDYLSPITINIFIFKGIKLLDLKNLSLLLELSKYINHKQFELLHFIGNSHWIALLNYLCIRVPKIHTIHEPYPFSTLKKYRLFRFKTKIKLILHSSTYIAVPSDTSFRRLSDHYKITDSKVGIVPFGPFEIYKEYSTPKVRKEDNIILFYGNISPYKGIDVLLKAMEKIMKINPELKLIIAGGGEFNYDVSNFHGNIQIINRYLTNREIANLNERAAIIVCPYLGASQSGVVMTSFAFGNPIIATRVGALPEMVDDGVTGIIIEPDNAEALGKIILDLFNDFPKIIKLRKGIQSKYFNSDNSWEKISIKTYQLYSKLSGRT